MGSRRRLVVKTPTAFRFGGVTNNRTTIKPVHGPSHCARSIVRRQKRRIRRDRSHVSKEERGGRDYYYCRMNNACLTAGTCQRQGSKITIFPHSPTKRALAPVPLHEGSQLHRPITRGRAGPRPPCGYPSDRGA